MLKTSRADAFRSGDVNAPAFGRKPGRRGVPITRVIRAVELTLELNLVAPCQSGTVPTSGLGEAHSLPFQWSTRLLLLQ